MGEDPLMMPRALCPQCDGIWRPPEDGSVGLGEDAQEDLVRGHPGAQDHGEIPVVGEPDVDARAHRPGGADLARLVALGRHDEGCPALAVLTEGRLVEQAGGQHGAVHAQEVIGGKAQRAVRGGRYLRGQLIVPCTDAASLAPAPALRGGGPAFGRLAMIPP